MALFLLLTQHWILSISCAIDGCEYSPKCQGTAFCAQHSNKAYHQMQVCDNQCRFLYTFGIFYFWKKFDKHKQSRKMLPFSPKGDICNVQINDDVSNTNDCSSSLFQIKNNEKSVTGNSQPVNYPHGTRRTENELCDNAHDRTKSKLQTPFTPPPPLRPNPSPSPSPFMNLPPQIVCWLRLDDS